MSKLLKIARQIKSSNFCIPPPHTPPPPMTETCVFRNFKSVLSLSYDSDRTMRTP
jgi:hypothetical protein